MGIITRILLLSIFILKLATSSAQHPGPGEKGSGMFVDSLNKFIDQCIVNKNFIALDTLYARDFAITQSNGAFIDKFTWMRTLKNNQIQYLSCKHDSTNQEFHPDVTIITGTLIVQLSKKNVESIYSSRYVRVFMYRKNKWELVSHKTVLEWTLPKQNSL
jgi:hypothetical protein